MTNRVAEDILKARDLIIERGWHQGDYENKDTGCLCTLGALNVVTMGSADPYEFFDRIKQSNRDHAKEIYKVLNDTLSDMEYDYLVPDYNDEEDRTVEEILEFLELAAANAQV